MRSAAAKKASVVEKETFEERLELVSDLKAEVRRIDRQLSWQELAVPRLEGISNYFRSVRIKIESYLQLNIDKSESFVFQMLEMEPTLLGDILRFIGRDTRRRIAEHVESIEFDALEKEKLLRLVNDGGLRLVRSPLFLCCELALAPNDC
jgi:hypothetical protein